MQNGQIKGIADFRSLLVPFSQEGLKGRSARLEDRTSIQPIEEDLSVAHALLDEAIAKMAEARTERDRVADTHPSTRSKLATEGDSNAAIGAEGRLEGAIANYDNRHEKYEKARRAADTRHAAETKDVEAILTAFRTSVPQDVLKTLVPGAVGIGSRATEDGRIVTPGTVVEAMIRYEDAQARPTIAEAIATIASMMKKLETKLSEDKPQLAWPQLITDLRSWHHRMGSQVGCLTAPIVGRWVVESVEKALATAGARPRLALLLEKDVGDGRRGTDLEWADLFRALEDTEVQQEAVVNLAKITWSPGVKGAARLAAIAARTSSYCYDFQAGKCTRGASCRYLHEMAPKKPEEAKK